VKIGLSQRGYIYTEVVRVGIAENNIYLRGRSNIRLE